MTSHMITAIAWTVTILQQHRRLEAYIQGLLQYCNIARMWYNT